MPVPVITVAQMREWERASWDAGQSESEVIRRVGRAVVDQTGLTGPWDLTLTYAPDSAQIPAGTLAPDAPPPAANPDAPSLTAALQEQLGLRLVSTTAPVDVLVVDRVSRPLPD